MSVLNILTVVLRFVPTQMEVMHVCALPDTVYQMIECHVMVSY